MTEAASSATLGYQWTRRTSRWRTARAHIVRFVVKKRLGAIGLVIVTFFSITAVFAPILSRYDPDQIFEGPNPNYKSNPSIADLAKDPNVGSPVIVEKHFPPSSEHWFGTDNFGRDIYARVIYGSRLSLIVGFGASVIAVGVGLFLGAVSAYYKGWVDLVLQRFVDALQAFPALVLLLLLVQIQEPSVRNTVLALGVIGIPIATRLVRSAVLTVGEADYVTAARALGATDLRIMLRHVLPNISAVLLVAFSIGIGAYILFEATISFLNVGPRNVVSWGKMVQEGRAAIDLHPWLTVFAGGSIALLVAGFNFLGDALRDVLDPRLGRV
ncbi:MAG: ABC transporter permease [Dehalococcoidia bacterium]